MLKAIFSNGLHLSMAREGKTATSSIENVAILYIRDYLKKS